jgi:hypothetical protein
MDSRHPKFRAIGMTAVEEQTLWVGSMKLRTLSEKQKNQSIYPGPRLVPIGTTSVWRSPLVGSRENDSRPPRQTMENSCQRASVTWTWVFEGPEWEGQQE